VALSDRERSRLRHVLDTVMRADDIVMDITDQRAVGGRSPQDEDLDALHEALSEALTRLERLLSKG
jgi:hypothetical protein